jgi:hypothetical protein
MHSEWQDEMEKVFDLVVGLCDFVYWAILGGQS